MNWRHIRQIGFLGGLILLLLPESVAGSIATPPSTKQDYIRPSIACPDDLDVLISMLLRDLPSYANRVNQRAFELDENRSRPGYVLLAGRPEFEPLTLGPGIYQEGTPDANVPQVFFTTLERQYVEQRSVNLQHYHWLFLTKASDGWRQVMMLSRIGDYPSDEPPSPPEDSTNGVIGRAVQLWLRDCRTGNVQPLTGK